MKVLRLSAVYKSYKLAGGKVFPVLKDVNVSFDRGELVSIIGESGSGKSTLMNVIGGLDSDFSGEVAVDGKNIGDYNEKELDQYRKNKVGFVFQSFNLIPHLSVLDNVTIAMTLSNVSKQQRTQRAEEILEQVGLKDHMYKKPDQLSGGQKQRVAIARALINDTEIIIADEPTGALDSETTEQVLDIIKEIAKRGKLVIMVTHSERVARHSSRIIELADGKIISDSEGPAVAQVNEEFVHTEINKRQQNLSFGSAIKLAFQNMKEKLSRNVWVSFGASIGIMSVILMLSLGNGMKTYFNDSMNSMVNPLVVEVNMPMEEEPGMDSDSMEMPPNVMLSLMGVQTPFEEEDIEKLSAIPNVVSAEKGFNLISFGTNTIEYNDKTSTIMALATVSSNLTASGIKEGELPGESGVLITEGMNEKLGGNMIGKNVTLNVVIKNQIFSGDFKVSGISAPIGNNPNSSMEMVYVSFDDLQQLAEDNDYDLQPTTMYLVTEDESYAEDIKAEVKELGYRGSTQETMTEVFTDMLDVLTVVLASGSGVSLFVSAIMILVVLHISVVERTKEIGVLKAIGARRKDIKRIFVSEAFLIGLTSGLIGVAVSSVLSVLANIVSNHYFDVSIMMPKTQYLIFGIVVSIVISMLAGIMPASKAAKLDPVDSLRRE